MRSRPPTREPKPKTGRCLFQTRPTASEMGQHQRCGLYLAGFVFLGQFKRWAMSTIRWRSSRDDMRSAISKHSAARLRYSAARRCWFVHRCRPPHPGVNMSKAAQAGPLPESNTSAPCQATTQTPQITLHHIWQIQGHHSERTDDLETPTTYLHREQPYSAKAAQAQAEQIRYPR